MVLDEPAIETAPWRRPAATSASPSGDAQPEASRRAFNRRLFLCGRPCPGLAGGRSWRDDADEQDRNREVANDICADAARPE